MNYISLLHISFIIASIGFFTGCEKDDIESDKVSIYDLRIDGLDYFLLSKGTTTTVKLRIIPKETTDKDIVWKSNNEEVAKVERGVITAVDYGVALITATSTSNPENKVDVRVRVLPPKVETIRFNIASTLTLDPNEVIKIASIVLPQDADQELIWKSSNESTATVNSVGKVIALSPGEVIISAISASDETISSSVKILIRGGLEESVLDSSKFVALPISQRFEFSQWGTNNLSVLWDNDINSLSTESIFYISNDSSPFFGIDLGKQTKLSSMRYWGRKDNYFAYRHPKTIMIYGTNDEEVAYNADSPDEDWIPLTIKPFESHRPSGLKFDLPIVGSMDWIYAVEGERYSFSSSIPVVRYLRVKCLSTWGEMEGFWGTEIAFWETQ